jgi:3-hydroxybutyryl-CoA dehydratase
VPLEQARHIDSIADLIGASVSVSRTIGETDVYLFGGITGDLSPYHFNERQMASSTTGGRIVHGLYLLSFAASASVAFWEPRGWHGATISYGFDRVRFLKPVRFGATVTGVYTLESYDAASKLARAKVLATDDDGDPVLAAVHLVKAVDLGV